MVVANNLETNISCENSASILIRLKRTTGIEISAIAGGHTVAAVRDRRITALLRSLALTERRYRAFAEISYSVFRNS
jgi:hypothetical protein